MTQQIAQIIVIAGTGIAWSVWFWAFYRNTLIGRKNLTAQSVQNRAFQQQSRQEKDVLTNSTILEKSGDVVIDTIAQTITGQSALGQTQALQIVEKTKNSISFVNPSGAKFSQVPQLYFTEGLVVTEDAGNKTKLSYYLNFEALRKKVYFITNLVLFLAGVPVLIGLPLLLWMLAVPSNTAGVRGQVIQIVQCVHVLWPPFLVMSFYNRGRKNAKAYFDSLINNVRFA